MECERFTYEARVWRPARRRDGVDEPPRQMLCRMTYSKTWMPEIGKWRWKLERLEELEK